MQHDHVLKGWNFDLLTPSRESEGGGSAGKIFSTCCCISDFFKFDMQHDDVLKKGISTF